MMAIRYRRCSGDAPPSCDSTQLMPRNYISLSGNNRGNHSPVCVTENLPVSNQKHATSTIEWSPMSGAAGWMSMRNRSGVGWHGITPNTVIARNSRGSKARRENAGAGYGLPTSQNRPGSTGTRMTPRSLALSCPGAFRFPDAAEPSGTAARWRRAETQSTICAVVARRLWMVTGMEFPANRCAVPEAFHPLNNPCTELLSLHTLLH